MKRRYASPSSSPPSPPSPLPVSVGPGLHKYSFSTSPSPSPPFSPPHSTHSSPDHLPLLDRIRPAAPPPFSLDHQVHDVLDSRSSCLKDLMEWLVQRCCCCCSWSLVLNPTKVANNQYN